MSALIEGIQQAIDVTTDVSAQLKGTLRVTASVSFGYKCIMLLLPQFDALYPDLTVDLLLTDAVVDLFAERINVAVRLGLLVNSTLISQRLMQTHYSVCTSPEYLKRIGEAEKPIDRDGTP